jgi:hypothetical protein
MEELITKHLEGFGQKQSLNYVDNEKRDTMVHKEPREKKC